METYYILYNPIAKNGEASLILSEISESNAKHIDITTLDDYKTFIESLDETDKIVVCGGDGTLNIFINKTQDINYNNDVYYYPAGTGNDFYHDVTEATSGDKILVNKYIKNLPSIKVKGKTYKFLNGVGYGIDGYCCEVGDKLRAQNKKKINYTMIAIKGLLFHYKTTNAKVIVDDIEHDFSNVWLAPVMNGKYYGGGMIPTPGQKRNTDELSVLIFQGKSKLKTLMIFPSIFKGEHVKKEKQVHILSGKKFKVIFDEPRPLQIDGETILDVSEYEAWVNE